jgi:hypothetical protein|tara:strand:- start:1069 stop:1338 length:270 start_codon:yes stop_codon:yes gene_type:complete
MTEKKEKVYLPSSIKNIKTQYGSMMVANFKMDELQANSKNGWVSMVISERREPSEKGATHYAYVNTYEPPAKENTSNKKTVKSNDDLPF